MLSIACDECIMCRIFILKLFLFDVLMKSSPIYPSVVICDFLKKFAFNDEKSFDEKNGSTCGTTRRKSFYLMFFHREEETDVDVRGNILYMKLPLSLKRAKRSPVLSLGWSRKYNYLYSIHNRRTCCPGSDGPENVAPVDHVLKTTGQPARRAGSYLQRSHRERFPVSLVPGTLVERIIGPGQWRGNTWRGCQPETRADQPSCVRARTHRERFREPIECRARRRQGWPSTSSTCCTLNSPEAPWHTAGRSSSTKHAQRPRVWP